MALELNPIIQRISTQYNPAGMAGFIQHLTSVKGLATIAIAGIGAVTGAIALCVTKTMAWGKELDNTMDLLGVTSKEAAGLGLIARVTGTSIDTLTRGLNIMGKGLVDVKGGLGTTGKELKAIGIDIYDLNGKLKSTPTLFQEVADYMSKLANGTEKTALEMKLFGRSGTEVDEILRQTANGGMQKYIDQAAKMGLALSADQVSKIEQLGFNLNMIKEQFNGIAVVLGIAFIPMIQSAVGWIGTFVGSLMPGITNLGLFLGLLMGATGTASSSATIPGNPGSEENQWRVAHGYQPNERYGAMPTEAVAGGNGGMSDWTRATVGTGIVIQPWMQAILDIKAGILKFDWQLLIDNIKTMAGWVGDVAKWIGSWSIGGKPVWQDQTGTAQGQNLSTLQQPFFDFGTWVDTAIIQPFKDAMGKSFPNMAGLWYQAVDLPLQRWYSQAYQTLYGIGEGIGSGINGFINKLIEAYNSAIEWINKILHTSLPTVGGINTTVLPSSAGVVTKNLRSSGGMLGPGWTMVGDVSAGVPGPYFELVGPDGYVYSHAQSVKMLGGLGKVKGLQGGGYFDPHYWQSGGGGTGGGSGGSSSFDLATTVKRQVQQSQSWAAPSQGGTTPQAAAQAATEAVSAAVTPAVASVSRSSREMTAASQQTAAAQRETADIQKALLDETRGLRRDMKQLQMITVAQIAKAMAA